MEKYPNQSLGQSGRVRLIICLQLLQECRKYFLQLYENSSFPCATDIFFNSNLMEIRIFSNFFQWLHLEQDLIHLEQALQLVRQSWNFIFIKMLMTCYIYARFSVKRFCWMKQVRGENMIFFTLEQCHNALMIQAQKT